MSNLTVVACLFLLISIISVSSGASVVIGLGDCQLLLNHLAGSDVNFKGGFDVRGKKIKGADYDIRPRIKLQNTITFDIATDIASKYNLRKKIRPLK